MKKFVSIILVIVIICTSSFSALAESVGNNRSKSTSAGDVFAFIEEITWAEAGKQIACMLSYIVEDAANINLEAHSARISGLSLEDDSLYLAILAENGYLPEAPEMIDPAAIISPEEYVQLLEIAFPTIVQSQDSIDGLLGVENPGNIAVMGENLSISALLPDRIAVSKADQLSITAVNAPALSLNAKGSVYLSESEIARVHIAISRQRKR
ncbi:MAG: hypothetical protein E7337_17250 [Clostridiales bacterium]|nr:hypothetical protein [Clostridiales bacterium]